MQSQTSRSLLHILLAFALAAAVSAPAAVGADPTLTAYNISQCQGSLRPYPAPASPAQYPDSLEPVFINHVGRHGARYPASANHVMTLRRALGRADSLGTITNLGRQLMAIADLVTARSQGRWGSLDSLGEAEQRGIASRMLAAYPDLLSGGSVSALSSYAPRCMMSMYAFTHQLDRLNNRLEFSTTAGRQNSALMRPWELDKDYAEFSKTRQWEGAYDAYFDTTCPTGAIRRVLGEGFPFQSDAHARQLALAEYYVLAGLQAMMVQDVDPLKFFTDKEYNLLWSCFNLRQYLQRTATTVSTVPADVASQLVVDLIATTERAVAGKPGPVACLRFGHAETLMPLLSLLRLQGCYYLTNYFDTVGLHWRDWEVVPMAANLQMVLFRAKASGRYYLRTDLNERPVPLIPNDPALYVPWGQARDYMTRCVPLYAQPGL